jgi:hypothetical protein
MMATFAENVMGFLSSVRKILGLYIKTDTEYCDPYLCQLIHNYSTTECYKICSLKKTLLMIHSQSIMRQEWK